MAKTKTVLTSPGRNQVPRPAPIQPNTVQSKQLPRLMKLLPPPHRIRYWLPTIVAVVAIGLAIAGALLFGGPELRTDTSATTTEQVKGAARSDTASASQLYAYEWKGETLATETANQDSVVVTIPKVEQADFERVSQALGITGDVRVTPYDDGIAAFESGTQLAAIDEGTGSTETSDAVFQDPNAYQLSAYSNQPSYWYTLLSGATWVEGHTSPLPSEDEAKAVAKDFFQSRNLLPSDAGEPFIRDSEAVAQTLDSAGAAEMVKSLRSIYFPRLVNGHEVVDESGEIIPYLMLDLGVENKVLSASGPFAMTPATVSNSKPGLSIADAWAALAANKWGPGTYSIGAGTYTADTPTSKLSMNTVRPTSFAIPSLQAVDTQTIEPAYVFTGTFTGVEDDAAYPISIVVPAVRDSAYAAYLQDSQKALTTAEDTEAVQPN